MKFNTERFTTFLHPYFRTYSEDCVCVCLMDPKCINIKSTYADRLTYMDIWDYLAAGLLPLI